MVHMRILNGLGRNDSISLMRGIVLRFFFFFFSFVRLTCFCTFFCLFNFCLQLRWPNFFVLFYKNVTAGSRYKFNWIETGWCTFFGFCLIHTNHCCNDFLFNSIRKKNSNWEVASLTKALLQEKLLVSFSSSCCWSLWTFHIFWVNTILRKPVTDRFFSRY